MFVVVPLHAAGTISVHGYGLVILLLLASCILMQSRSWSVIAVLVAGIGLAVAAHLLRATAAQPNFANLDLFLDAFAWIIIDLAMIVVIARAVFAPGRITYHRVNGAILLYLAIGLTFVGLYTLVGLFSPNSFAGLNVSHNRELASSIIYFSFVTLTSVGYGDIVPVHPMARALANLEGIIGQLFPATLLARMVTLQLEDRRDRRKGQGLITARCLDLIGAVLGAHEDLVDLRVAHWIAGCIGQKVLLRDVGDIFGFRILSEEVIEWLILARPDFFGNGLPPFIGVREHRVDVINNAPERIFPVLDDLTDAELCDKSFHNLSCAVKIAQKQTTRPNKRQNHCHIWVPAAGFNVNLGGLLGRPP